MKRVKEIVHYGRPGYYGKDITVVVMDTGMEPHPDLGDNLWKFKDFINGRMLPYDDNGHGTHVAGIIGGRKYGMAPLCRLIVLKVLGSGGNGDVIQSMKGFRWIIENQEKYNIRVVNISMGMKRDTNKIGEKRILAAVDVLWRAGIVVVAAAGNYGPREGSITIPGLHPSIITVGSYDERYSGRGSSMEHIWKPDVVAPGRKIISCNVDGNYIEKSGTSMATPVVSGAITLLLSKYPNLTNDEIKRKLRHSCDDLGLSGVQQGSGLLNIQKFMH